MKDLRCSVCGLKGHLKAVCRKASRAAREVHQGGYGERTRGSQRREPSESEDPETTVSQEESEEGDLNQVTEWTMMIQEEPEGEARPESEERQPRQTQQSQTAQQRYRTQRTQRARAIVRQGYQAGRVIRSIKHEFLQLDCEAPQWRRTERERVEQT
jgi:hypothetical protein